MVRSFRLFRRARGGAGRLRRARHFRPVAETGQLLPRSPEGARGRSWSASILYATLRRHQPDHPLLRETIRETLEDRLDAAAAEQQARVLFETRWQVFDLPRPSPMAVPLFAAFHREVLFAQDPDRALEDFAFELDAAWDEPAPASEAAASARRARTKTA